ncbi:MAG: protein kinase, partial [Acidobacteriota bacterium]
MLGRGGMGQVFEAWDPRLDRRVAIKLMREGDPRLLERFGREARAQAALSHPAICPVHEVGDDNGIPFIVMQRLDGVPLDEAVEDLSIEAKLTLMRQVAEAVHEAHRTGLIHRDLKPSNVLVETPPGEAPRPYVLDFGLARPLDRTLGPAITEEGMAVGTPAFMAPEQLRADLGALDRRTDVYGLGATLYCLLAGEPPFRVEGPTFATEVLHRDPPALRSQGVPRDVEIIVFKCLEKDPARRYGSAKELADDLGRYLDGEPIVARPASTSYRVATWVRRHRPLAASLLALFLTLGGSIGWSAHSDFRAQQREVLVASFVEDVEEMEAEVRFSHMAPLHDIRPDRELLRDRMTTIRATMEAHDDVARGAGHFALGSGHLALEELEQAHHELELAWNAGYRTPESASALARTLSALYREHLADVELVVDWHSRREKLVALDARYGEPLRAYLTYTVEHEPLLKALAHFQHDRFEEALDVLESSQVQLPWDYELPRFEGEIRRAWAIEKNFDNDSEEARRQLELARDAYRRAADIAESDPSIHRALAQVAFQWLNLDKSSGEQRELFQQQGLAAAERALTANLDDTRAWLWKARLHRGMATDLQQGGHDPVEHLEHAITSGRRAAEADTAPAWRELGRGHVGLARWLESRGEAPFEPLDRAAEALAQIAVDDRQFYDEHLTAMVHQIRARYRTTQGEDASDDHIAAIEAYQAAIALHSAPYSAWINLGSTAMSLAVLDSVDDAEARLRQAVEAFTHARELRPESAVAAYYLGVAQMRLAQGGNPATGQLDLEVADQAVASFHLALELRPSLFQARVGLGEIYHLRALERSARGQPPGDDFNLARAAYRAALEAAPDHAITLSNLAWTEYFEGKLRVRAGNAPGDHLKRALALSTQAFESIGLSHALLCVGSTHRMEAEWRLRSGVGDIVDTIDRSRQAFDQLLELDPQHAEAHRSLGRLLTLEGQWRRLRGEEPRLQLDAARHLLERAVELEPDGRDYWLALARRELE